MSAFGRTPLLAVLGLCLTSLLMAPPASAQRHQGRPGGGGPRYTRALVSYSTPDVSLVDMNESSVSLPELLDGDDAVVLQFVFTTCRTACPKMIAKLANAQPLIAKGPDTVRLVSISIDPEHDTPERLREYAAGVKAGPGWSFLTGDLDTIVSVQKAFGVYHETKERHPPTTLVRNGAEQPWLRLDGFVEPAQLATELDSLRGGDGSTPP